MLTLQEGAMVAVSDWCATQGTVVRLVMQLKFHNESKTYSHIFIINKTKQILRMFYKPDLLKENVTNSFYKLKRRRKEDFEGVAVCNAFQHTMLEMFSHHEIWLLEDSNAAQWKPNALLPQKQNKKVTPWF